MEKQLFHSWLNLASKYTDDHSLIHQLWEEICEKYSSKKRYYHNLTHLDHMFYFAKNDRSNVYDNDSLQFAVWYQDIIYNGAKSNNELKSAEFAKKRLKTLKIEAKKIDFCVNLIISTKKHELLNTENQDNAYLLDWDLAILGTPWETYELYTQKIRKEYAMFPDFMYKKGRKKVLQHFLERPRIYYTEKYHDLWETIARKNIQKELSKL